MHVPKKTFEVFPFTSQRANSLPQFIITPSQSPLSLPVYSYLSLLEIVLGLGVTEGEVTGDTRLLGWKHLVSIGSRGWRRGRTRD
jgi:hypothetical protein